MRTQKVPRASFQRFIFTVCVYVSVYVNTCTHMSAGILGDQRHGIPLEVVYCPVWMLELEMGYSARASISPFIH